MSAATDDVSKLPLDVIDVDVFEQLLDMDEDGREFSQSLVWNYFEQAEQTFAKMEEASLPNRWTICRRWATF